jgi:protoporphyrinogen oxidase
MTDQTPPTYYLQEMLYPRLGGFRAFLEPLIENLDLRSGKKAVLVNPKRGYVEFADGTTEYYEHLVSSIPLPELALMLEGATAAVKEAAESLWATSVALVSLGFSCPQAGDHLWFYIYDREILPARVHAPYRKSPDNAPAGKSSLQFETYFSRYSPLEVSPENLVAHVVEAAEKMGLALKSDIIASDFRILPYANVVFDHDMIARRDFILDYLKSQSILTVGRFGEWDYLWSDQSFLSGSKVEGLKGMV